MNKHSLKGLAIKHFGLKTYLLYYGEMVSQVLLIYHTSAQFSFSMEHSAICKDVTARRDMMI